MLNEYTWINWPQNRMFAPVLSNVKVDILLCDGTVIKGISAGSVMWESEKV